MDVASNFVAYRYSIVLQKYVLHVLWQINGSTWIAHFSKA